MIIDCHIHLAPPSVTWWRGVIETEKDFYSYYKKCGIDKAILSNGVERGEPKTAKRMLFDNEAVIKFAKKHPKMFLPAVVPHPAFGKDSLELLERSRREYGIVWCGELCNYMTGYSYSSPESLKMLDKVMDLNMILQIHSTDEEVELVLKRYPKMPVVLPHLGDGRNAINNRIGLAVKYKNLYLDLCGSGADRIGNVEEIVRRIGDDRVLFGTDYHVNEPGVVVTRVEHSLIKKSSKEKIFYKNVRKLLASKGVTF